MPSKTSDIPSATPLSRGGEPFRFLPVGHLRTTYSVFRSCQSPGHACDLKPLPLRVVAAADGQFEILDGFKRFAAWIEEGRERVPVIVEAPGSRAEHKRLLLLANAPRRTLTPLDEACVVSSLLEEDRLTPAATAKLLGRRKEWVLRRRALVTHLSTAAQARMARGELGPFLALCVNNG